MLSTSCEASAFSKETPIFLKCNSPLFLIAIIFVKYVLVRIGSAPGSPESAFDALASTAGSCGSLGPRPPSAAVPAAAGGGRWRGGARARVPVGVPARQLAPPAAACPSVSDPVVRAVTYSPRPGNL